MPRSVRRSIVRAGLGLLTCLAAALVPVSAAAQAKDTFGPGGEIYVGADYYPEHCPRERWDEDTRLMKEAGFNVVRLAEFIWVLLEPEEGRYDFAWLDEAIKYAETLAMKPDGTRVVWGGWKNNCFSEGTYRLLSERITRAMAERYARTANVIGWQTDNEFSGTDCRCHLCRAGFRDWLRRRYTTLEELNRAWGTHFWGLKVQAWDEIPIPDSRTGAWAISNPSASLDLAALHLVAQRALPGRPGPHPPRPVPGPLHHPQPDGPLPGDGLLRPRAGARLRGLRQLSRVRQLGPARPGEIRSIAYQQLAHGADAQVWFRWRTATAGREQYWHGLLGHDGKPGRRYREAAQVAREYRALQAPCGGRRPARRWPSSTTTTALWALRIQPGFSGNTYAAALRRYYDAFFRAGVNVDLVPPGAGVKDETGLVHPRTLPGLLAPALGIVLRGVAGRGVRGGDAPRPRERAGLVRGDGREGGGLLRFGW
jgi:beta-galactosidase